MTVGLTPDISPKSNNWSASLVRLVTTWIRLPYTLIRVALFHLKWKRRLERHYGIFMKWNMTWVKWCGNFGARCILWKLAKLKKISISLWNWRDDVEKALLSHEIYGLAVLLWVSLFIILVWWIFLAKVSKLQIIPSILMPFLLIWRYLWRYWRCC